MAIANPLAAASPNFGFLARTDVLLAETAGLAERGFQGDPRACVIRLRLFGEGLARRVAASSGVAVSASEQQLDLLRRLEDHGALPREAAQLFHHLRRVGNRATHELEARIGHREALDALKLAREAALWFQRSFIDRSFRGGPFIPPAEPVDATLALRTELAELRAQLVASLDAAQAAQQREQALAEARLSAEKKAQQEAEEKAFWEQVARDLEDEKAVVEAQLTALRAEATAREAAAVPPPQPISAQLEAAAHSIYLDEATTRRMIDEQLRAAGWEADTDKLHYSRGTRPAKHRNLAIAEWPTESGPADYALFIGLELVGIVEAKRLHTDIPAALEQAKRYSRAVRPLGDERLVGGHGKHGVPFLFATNGRPYLRQLQTKSGIWMLDTRQPTNLAKALLSWYTPAGLVRLQESNEDKAKQALAEQSLEALELRRYQRDAITEIEQALARGQREVLVAMATGTGKTRTCLALLYRLLSARWFRRVLFVVDRTALGEQAEEAARQTPIDGRLALAQVFNIKGLKEPALDPETRLHFATVQGLIQRVLYSDEPAPIDQYDCIIIDECHRGYTLDRELDDSQLGIRDERDYISKYRRVLDHFDAVKVGLTATPALHTVEIFGHPVYTYSYTDAVVDGFLVDHEPPVRLLSALTVGGIHYAAGEEVEVFRHDRQAVDLVSLPDELDFDVDDFNRRVINENTTRALCEELARHIDPGLPGKTLIFCVNDEHASRVVAALKLALSARYPDITDDSVAKITGSVDKPQQRLRRYRNEREPQVAVTVDLLTTGVDVPKIVNLVFLRRVRSRILYTQMMGRATRLCPEIGKDCFRIFDAVELYQAMEKFTDMKPVARRPNISFAQLLRELQAPISAESLLGVRNEFLAKLRRKLLRVGETARADVQTAAGISVEQLPATLAELDPAALTGWLGQRPLLLSLLDQIKTGRGDAVVLSSHPDHVVAVGRGYGPDGQGQQPEDYLEAFGHYLRTHLNELPALLVVTQRPRELTRQQLRQLQLKLAEDGYTEARLRTAWRETKNQDLAASIIGHIRQHALGEPLVPYEERVDRALQRIGAQKRWTDIQRQWLTRIGQQLKREVVVDRESLDQGQFQVHGGFKRLNTVFDGSLQQLLGDLQEAVWEQASAG